MGLQLEGRRIRRPDPRKIAVREDAKNLTGAAGLAEFGAYLREQRVDAELRQSFGHMKTGAWVVYPMESQLRLLIDLNVQGVEPCFTQRPSTCPWRVDHRRTESQWGKGGGLLCGAQPSEQLTFCGKIWAYPQGIGHRFGPRAKSRFSRCPSWPCLGRSRQMLPESGDPAPSSRVPAAHGLRDFWQLAPLRSTPTGSARYAPAVRR